MKSILMFTTSALLFAGCSSQAMTLHELATPGKFPPLFSDPGRQQPRELVYKTVGDRGLKLYVFDPAGHMPDQKRPAILFIHGGGWGTGEPAIFFPHARYFASRGLVAMSVEYRLSGKEGATIFECISDCKSAMRYIRANVAELGIDPEMIAVGGDSAGGHLTASLGIIEGFDDPQDDLSISPKPDAMLLYNPVLDLVSLNWTRSHPGVRTPDEKTAGSEKLERVLAYGPTPEERARRLSPMHAIATGQAPVFLMHGTEDKSVPVEQAYRFAKLYEEAGNSCELHVLEDIAHAFVLVNYWAPDEVIVDAIRAGDRFLASLGYLEGEPTLRVPKAKE